MVWELALEHIVTGSLQILTILMIWICRRLSRADAEDIKGKVEGSVKVMLALAGYKEVPAGAQGVKLEEQKTDNPTSS